MENINRELVYRLSCSEEQQSDTIRPAEKNKENVNSQKQKIIILIGIRQDDTKLFYDCCYHLKSNKPAALGCRQ